MPSEAFANRYRIDADLGQGGMGVVRRAHDTLLDRPVAIKVLSNVGLGTEGRARLLAEARAAARLDHPNIVSVYDTGEADGTPYIVMQLVEGESLHARRPRSLDDVLAVAGQILAALEHAHTHGIVHRDLKPENVLVTPDGTVKLVDFGLARPAASRLSTEGALSGTVFYLAPEFALDQPFDGRADLYALGVMLYELTTGELPFKGGDPLSVIAQHLHSPAAPPRSLNPELPQPLDALILQLLAKRPEDRPASAADVRRALDDHLGTTSASRGAARNTGAKPPHNLPGQALPLVGRQAEVEAALRELSRPEVRLLTFTGPGGVGKTRLSLQVAERLLERFEDGVFFVPLAPLRDEALVLPAIAQALGVREGGDLPLVESLKHFLKARRLLLVVDNFEHVMPAASALAELIAGAPHVKMLVTSRELLRVYGEQGFPIPPLALPDAAQLPAERVAEYEAVQLFLQRAKAVKPDFALTGENAAAVVEICRRLDGLPLAIELAAARVRLMPPAKILDGLGNRFRLLSGGARDLPERHQSLHGAIEWSHGLLNADEQRLFRRLAVFAGGATFEAVDTVCLDAGELDALEGVQSLVDKSLLKQTEIGGEPRFQLLESIREYALERLAESGEADALRERHLRYFAAQVDVGAADPDGPELIRWIERAEQEHGNIRAALGWVLGREGEVVQVALGMAAAFGQLWDMHGHLREGRDWLEALLGRSPERTLARGRALDELGVLVFRLGDVERMSKAGDESLAVFRELGEKKWIARALNHSAWPLADRGNQREARARLEESLAINRELGETRAAVSDLLILAEVLRADGDLPAAMAYNEEAIALARPAGLTANLAVLLGNSGLVAVRLGDLERARACLAEAISLGRALGHQNWIALNLIGLAGVAGNSGEAGRAARLIGAADALMEAIGAQIEFGDRADYEDFLATTRAQLDEAAFARSYAEGRAMTMDEAIAYTLETPA